MTWTYNLSTDNSTLEIYDQTDELVRTIENDGSGFDIKNEVLEAMEDAALAEYQANGFTNKTFAILRDAIFENIEAR